MSVLTCIYMYESVMSLQANRHGKKLYVMDARPKINAYANIVSYMTCIAGAPDLHGLVCEVLAYFVLCVQAMGGGYELDEAYQNMDFCFLDIGNIHVMRERCGQNEHVHACTCIIILCTCTCT